MAQHDYNIANGTGSAVRSDLNNALAAIVSMNSGSTEPSTTFAFQFWADTNANLLKMRNSANDGWIELRQLDGEFTNVSVANGTAAAPSIFFNASGTDTGIYSNGTDSVDVSTGGTRRLDIGSAGDVTVRGGNVTLNAQGDLRFADSDSSNWVAFQAPATVASNVTWTLPSADGANGQALSTNGSGTLSWSTLGGDKIEEGNTSAEVVDTGSDGHFKVTTEGTEALRVDASQRLLVKTTSTYNADGDDLVVASSGDTGITIATTSTSSTCSIHFADGTTGVDAYRGNFRYDHSANNLSFSIGDNHAWTTDVSQRFMLGHTSAVSNLKFGGSGNFGSRQYIYGANQGFNNGLAILNYDATASVPALLKLGSSRNDTPGNNTAPGSGDTCASIQMMGNDGTKFIDLARIDAVTDATPGTDDMPGRLVFSTTSDGGSVVTERMRLDSSGNLKFNSGFGSVGTAFGCRAWVRFDGTGTVFINGDGGVTSISDNATGVYTINFDFTMPDTNYSVVGTTLTRSGNFGGFFSIKANSSGVPDSYTTSGVRILTAETTNGSPTDPQIVCAAIFR